MTDFPTIDADGHWVCPVCSCLVPSTFKALNAHTEWHEIERHWRMLSDEEREKERKP